MILIRILLPRQRLHAIPATLVAVAALTLGLAPPSPAAEGERNPNIVLILADDLGYGDVGCYNPESRVPTPHMDRLAKEGMRFTDAYAPGAVCVPTRYGLLTGRYPFRANLNWGKQSVIDAERMTLGSLLKKHGYATACVGKWHQGFDGGKEFDCSGRLSGGPVDRGFDRYFGLHASLDIPPYFYIRDARCVEAPTQTTEDHVEEGYPIRYQGRFWRAGKIAPNFDHDEVLDRLADEAVAFLRQHRRESPRQPFFLYFPLTAPHGPWVPGVKFRGKSEVGKYGDFLLHTDHVVGRVLKTLDELGCGGEETLVIFTSDNGPLWFDENVEKWGHHASGPFRGRKGDIWDGGVHMPFLVRWPGHVPAGEVSGEVIGLTDLLATFAALVGEELPDDAGEDSYNVLPAMLGQKRSRPIREALLVQSSGRRLAIRQGDWKYIPWLGSGGFLTKPSIIEPESDGPRGQLYNLAKDPAEQKNLYREHPEIVERLAGLLKRYQEQDRSVKRGK